jgi:hypothetical protein
MKADLSVLLQDSVILPVWGQRGTSWRYLHMDPKAAACDDSSIELPPPDIIRLLFALCNSEAAASLLRSCRSTADAWDPPDWLQKQRPTEQLATLSLVGNFEAIQRVLSRMGWSMDDARRALHRSVFSGHYSIVRLLLQHVGPLPVYTSD